jgi:hypothetical protein
MKNNPIISSDITEKILYWYLRLNGFYTFVNFIVHNERGEDVQTEIDVAGVRFPERKENLARPMKDEIEDTSKIIFVIADATTGDCKINDSWQKADVIKSVLTSLGVVRDSHRDLDTIVSNICNKGFYALPDRYFSFLSVGKNKDTLPEKYKNVYQYTWDEILKFIHNRFKNYSREKANHGQWNETGQFLWDEFKKVSDVHQYITNILKIIYQKNSNIDYS